MSGETSDGATVYLMGAGASHGYGGSRTGVNPPLATSFFGTFSRLMISADLEVRIGFIINYIRDTRGIAPERMEGFEENIETVFAEIHENLLQALAVPKADVAEAFSLLKAYDQFIFWFAHILNEIQNGAPDPVYAELVRRAGPDDVFVTFNWDTLLDRVLANTGAWFPDDGYGVRFEAIHEKGWRPARDTRSRWPLLKLHGSTNWMGPYATIDFMARERRFMQAPERARFRYCVVDSSTRYAAYKDRWRPGYEPYSYFFPPDDPVSGAHLMPILIPPSGKKDFSEFPDVFAPVWSAARAALASARRLVIIGYSFPPTDGHAFDLLDVFLSGPSAGKRIEIIDPYPDGVAARVRAHVAGRCPVEVDGRTLSEHLGFERPSFSDSQYDRWTTPDTVQQVLDDEVDLEHLEQLMALNLDRRPFDLSTVDGRRYLSCRLRGEFATHMLAATTEETFVHRISAIPLTLEDHGTVAVDLREIDTIIPLPRAPIPPAALASVDVGEGDVPLAPGGPSLRELVAASYHAETDAEADAFLRRVLAANLAIAAEPDD